MIQNIFLFVDHGKKPKVRKHYGIIIIVINTVYSIVLEKAMAPHSSTRALKIPWTEEPGRLQSMGSLKVGHD